ncbi:nicotinate-nucleotide--dimethylbenzimidazole phosphoribosyltransferase [Aquipseudomonas ullengensis]|uniref:Nicotinate-nucleotide--dimethylbenzimidazole phosphoribosyltransferase n=1 Tax=Aquipseudomonas ullengensis TaxID=2759166 RepID=A0A7W4LL42_9GAMM|nr:nicotinate-nucleotide--dimethylbenzimidazole phosphoribosyltransferase [Pseudomonas ullengensis]MBB2495147.1 nicotinate-nucleotide--dimethylbenzimidazole phosphoribosyltransferase [Pseudomonas ullengensis]
MSTAFWWQQAFRQADEQAAAAARQRQTQLTKPAGSLGQLEQLAITLAGLQGRERPSIGQPWIAIFAGDHGVVEEGVSAFPQAVTGQMLHNFVNGGAAISVLARQLDALLDVVDLGTAVPLPPLPGVRHLQVGAGTRNFAREPAMSQAQCLQALEAGRDSVRRARAAGAELFIGGEMGIGNTTAAAALACALLGQPADALVGPGTGLDSAGVAHKAQVIERALVLHAAQLNDPLQVLRHLGGFEIAALAGAYLACAEQGLPALVDGFICTVAALCTVRLNPACRDWLLFAHCGAEPGHRLVLDALQAEPLLQLGLRLGEGSGAALAVPLLRLACALHNEMATFAEAAVSDRPV